MEIDIDETLTLFIISVLGFMTCMYGLKNRDGKAIVAFLFALLGLARVIVGLFYLVFYWRAAIIEKNATTITNIVKMT